MAGPLSNIPRPKKVVKKQPPTSNKPVKPSWAAIFPAIVLSLLSIALIFNEKNFPHDTLSAQQQRGLDAQVNGIQDPKLHQIRQVNVASSSDNVVDSAQHQLLSTPTDDHPHADKDSTPQDVDSNGEHVGSLSQTKKPAATNGSGPSNPNANALRGGPAAEDQKRINAQQMQYLKAQFAVAKEPAAAVAEEPVVKEPETKKAAPAAVKEESSAAQVDSFSPVDSSASSSASASSPDMPPEAVVFYHTFLGRPGESPKYEIIQEQLGQLHSSYIYQNVAVARKQALRIFYTTIANKDYLQEFQTKMEQFCTKLNFQCQHLNHYDEGFEEKTMTPLHDFCTNPKHAPANADASVIYIHNKGSFHELKKRGKLAGSNHHWRASLTAAAAEGKCYRGLHDNVLEQKPEATCNVCGSHVTTFPSVRVAGNLWTASCDYVRKLHAPEKFNVKMEEMKDRLQSLATSKLLSDKGIIAPNPVWDDRFTGRERFRWEWYIALHPEWKICDLAKKHSKEGFFFWKRKDKTVKSVAKFFKLRTQLEPLLVDDAEGGFSRMMNKTTLADRDQRLRDFLLLPGYMVRFSSLYEQLPTRQHWIWDHFPDGDVWKPQFDKLLYNQGETPLKVQYEQVVEVLRQTLPMESNENGNAVVAAQ